MPAEFVQRLAYRAGGAAVDRHARERDLEQFADIRFIVDDECEWLGHSFLLRRGSVKLSRKQLPPAGRSWYSMRM